jgi:hypothetical protein
MRRHLLAVVGFAAVTATALAGVLPARWAALASGIAGTLYALGKLLGR